VLSTLGGHKSEMGRLVILPKIRDPRFITVRRGGTLQDDDHARFHVLPRIEEGRGGVAPLPGLGT